MMDYLAIINAYYPSENDLRRILLTHSRSVADRCLLIARKHPELRLDTEFLEEAAMLHDIGIVRCNAPGIMHRSVNAILAQVCLVYKSRNSIFPCHLTVSMNLIRWKNRSSVMPISFTPRQGLTWSVQ